jgi:hypothetical protein
VAYLSLLQYSRQRKKYGKVEEVRRYGKKDDNHNLIVKDLQCIGFGCLDLSTLGDDVPDLLISRNGLSALVEIKIPGKEPNKTQKEWADKWPGECFCAHSSKEVYEKWQAYSKRKLFG